MNIVLTKKKWSEKTIRLNIDTRAMEMYVDVTNFPICRVPRQAEQGVARLAWRGTDKGCRLHIWNRGEHDKRVLAVLHRLQEYGMTLRREKCKLGQPDVIWFGNVFHKQGISPDPDKVANIRAGRHLKTKLQTTQFRAPYMGPGKGRTYADITS